MFVRRIRTCVLLLSALLPLLMIVSPVAAQDSAPASSVIAELHFTGSRNYKEAVLATVSGLKPGDAVTKEQLQAVADRFLQFGLFTSANYRFTSRGSQIVLEYQLQDAPTVPVLFDNFPWFTDDEITAAIRVAVPLFDGNAPTAGGMLDAMDAAIAQLLSTRGISGHIEHTLTTQPVGDDSLVQFRVEGPQLIIGSLEYDDSLAQSSNKLHDPNLALIGKPFSRFAIEMFETEQIRPIYHSTGHLKVHFGAPTIRLAGDPNQPLPSKLPVLVPIDPGPVFHLSSVTVAGNTAVGEAAIANFVGMKMGDLADGMKLDAACQRIALEYAHRGYLEVKVEAQPQFDDAAATVSYRLVVTEGPQYRMRDLVITGLSADASDALRLRWELKRGSVADGAYVDEMLAKLEKPTGEIFGDIPVHYANVGHWLRTDPESHIVDVLLDFK